MARALVLGCALLATAGCGVTDYEVVCVADGHTHVGRFVSSAAYQASMEAAIAEAKGDWPHAVELWTHARDEDPDGPELQAHLGVALCHVGKLQAGEFALNDALRIDPELEVGWTGRAQCKLLAKSADYDAIRADLAKALQANGDALEPALLFVDVELRQGRLKQARARAEEAVAMHPSSASAWRMLVEVAVRQGDGHRALIAVQHAIPLDDAIGKQAKGNAVSTVDRAGVASDSLAIRGSALPLTETISGVCKSRLEVFVKIASRAEPAAVSAAADGMRAVCPEMEAEVTRIECVAIWTPKNAEDVEARALAAPSASARRWGARMRLRRKSIAELLAPDALPRAEDRPTLALHVAVAALRAQGAEAIALATTAHDLAPSEPTV
ncbi:MAG: tetratricopeptide repeat protein, partial [Polyangiales bacterium]